MILTPKEPTATLTRVQSGVGILTVELACSDAVGDVRLASVYQLRSGHASLVQGSGPRTGPASSPRPVLLTDRQRFERLTLDLRQSRELERLVVLAYSETNAVLRWGGTLLVRTFGQSTVEVLLDREPSAGVLVALSLYNVDGEYVLRAESDLVAGTVRDAATAYGYDRVAWLDAGTPLD